ncbi:TrkA-N domain protein [Solidesulfovibrio fructosivorans JJ]]|uniref:TrkA-N domain protein n=1 Tax=Solidesulfovibrio fructosivorans JJ] TaxID=596151 RepID=E1JS10_SOLFR|nr:TrkA family potassium uptake protein [Solidesulfovibrio fructosivorans]EFL52779.1 TrkA-N domain protein [Solidesulfovibrio fructosivorans JJ]]
MAQDQVCIIGLGKFGFHMGRCLVELGRPVIGVDGNPEKVKNAQNIFTQVYQLDAKDKRALAQIHVEEMSHVVVSVGHSMEASILISLYLKELGVPQVWVKAVSTDHEKLLMKIGVDTVFIPERFAAKNMAHQLASPGLIEYLPMDKDVAIKEIGIDDWAGRTLRQLDLTNKHQVQVIAWKRADVQHYSFIPKADEPLGTGDKLVLVGREDRLARLRP